MSRFAFARQPDRLLWDEKRPSMCLSVGMHVTTFTARANFQSCMVPSTELADRFKMRSDFVYVMQTPNHNS